MKKILIVFLLSHFLNHVIFASTELIADCERVAKNVKKESLKDINALLIRASLELDKKFDEKLLVATVELFKSSYVVDANYYSVEFIYPIFKKHKESFLKEAKKKFSKENYKRFLENVALYENEQKVGNDPK